MMTSLRRSSVVRIQSTTLLVPAFLSRSMKTRSESNLKNDCLEANVQEAYGIFEEENDSYRTRFALLSAQVDELELYVEEENGQRIEASEVRLEDLSRHYDDETERWLYVTVNKEQSE